MRKSLADLIDTLKVAVKGIADTGVENRDELLTKSFTDFRTEMKKQLDVEYGEDGEPLAKGLNHIATYASALNRFNQVVEAIKTGRPGYMLDGDSSATSEPLPAEIVDDMDHAIDVGILALRAMVNNSVELPADDDDLERAEQAGQLVKVEFREGDVLVKSVLPSTFDDYIIDPVELMTWRADLSERFLAKAADMAEVLLQENKVPPEIIEAYPSLFELEKAFPPPKKKPAAAAGSDELPNTAASADNGDDDPDDTNAGDQSGDGDEPTDLTDDMPQDPLQMMARLGSMIVVIASSLSQGQGDTADQGQGGNDTTISGNPNDPRNVGLQRAEAMLTTPLAKIFNGAIEGDQNLVQVFDELDRLRDDNKELTTLRKQFNEATQSLNLLQATVDRMQAQPAPAKGFAKIVRKTDDSAMPGAETTEELTNRIAALAKSNPEGDQAAALTIKAIHSKGGSPSL